LEQLKSSPNLHPLVSITGYHLFFHQIPYQDLDIINYEFTKAAKQRKFWWVEASDLLAGKTPLKLYVRLSVMNKKLCKVVEQLLLKINR
jgi:hypothetical protein